MTIRVVWRLITPAFALLAFLCTTSFADAQMDAGQAQSYVRYKFPQLANKAWQLYSQTTEKIGTPEELAALARLELIFNKDDFGAPQVDTRCPNARCTLRINAGFIGLSLVFALSSAASAHLGATAGLAAKCFADNVDSLARAILSSSADNPYVPLLPCLGKTDVPLQTLVDNQEFNDLADIAVIETLAFAFAHELAHVKNGDLGPGSETRTIREIETRADIDAVEFLARAGIDAFFGTGAVGVFRLAEKLSLQGSKGDYPPTECRILYTLFASGYFLVNLDRSKLAFDTQYEKQLRSRFDDWRLAEVAAFVKQNAAKIEDGSCPGYFQLAKSPG
jgi:hypothetical protein